MLVLDHLTKIYGGGRKPGVPALSDVCLTVERGRTLGLVGESGAGKTTLTRCVLGLELPTAGRILFDGQDLARLSRRDRQAIRARLQVVFQDPFASLDPRLSAQDIVLEPMQIHRALLGLSRAQQRDRVRELLELVGLRAEHAERFPHQFSGGQRQRIGIARALACEPHVLMLDEPTSALDLSVQAQILNLLLDLQQRLGLTYLFITHDLGVVRHVSQRVAVLYRGTIIEEGDTETLFTTPRTTYMQGLLKAIPDPDPDLSPFRVS